MSLQQIKATLCALSPWSIVPDVTAVTVVIDALVLENESAMDAESGSVVKGFGQQPGSVRRISPSLLHAREVRAAVDPETADCGLDGTMDPVSELVDLAEVDTGSGVAAKTLGVEERNPVSEGTSCSPFFSPSFD